MTENDALDNFMIPQDYNSRFVDVTSLPPDSLLRVAELSRTRRSRLMAEEEEWQERQKFKDESSSILSQAYTIMAKDEEVARDAVVRAEVKGFDRITKMYHESSSSSFHDDATRSAKIAQLEEKRAKKLAKLEQELYKASFHSFWEQKRQSTKKIESHQEVQPSATKLLNQSTMLLRKAYEFSVPPFTTDPEEAWKRGVTIAPDLQHATTISGKDGSPSRSRVITEELNLPSYHEFAMRLRHKYDQHKVQQYNSPGGSRHNFH